MINRIIIILITLLFNGCIDLITEQEFYESVHVQGGSWLQFFENEEPLKFNSNFSVQIWFSGKEQIIQEAPCILSIQNSTTKLSVYRDININNNLIIYLNDNLILNLLDLLDSNDEELINLSNTINFDEENFYLLTAVINDTNASIYLNDIMLINNIQIEPGASEIMIGSYLDNNQYPNNLWYGYIDEIRLWDMALTGDIIDFHNQYPDKVSSAYDDPYLNSLNGVWDFKISTQTDNIPYIYEDINENNRSLIIYGIEEAITSELSTLRR